MWVEAAGVTCKAHSLAGAREGFLHSSALPLFVWAFSMKKSQPHLVIHECVLGFPTDILRQILNESGHGPMCAYALHPDGCTWDIAKLECCPTDLGIPSRRKRQYTRSVMTKVFSTSSLLFPGLRQACNRNKGLETKLYQNIVPLMSQSVVSLPLS